MIFPTAAAITTRRNSLGGTLGGAIGLPSCRAYRHGRSGCHDLGAPLRRVAAQHTGFSVKTKESPRASRGGQCRCLRAPPDLTAASATAAATVGTTRASNIDGVMYSSLSSPLATIDASAWAAASFIWSLTRLARTSSMPRKNPGKQHELLIWFG